MAAVAAAGLAAAPAQASGGKLYACYSKRSHVMRYSKGSRCARGSKSLSWRKSGPQGPQGPQGAPGQTAAFAAYDSNLLLAQSSNGSYARVVAGFVPSQTGLYVVNAQTTLENSVAGSNFVGCWAVVSSSSGDVTAPQFDTMTAKSQIIPVGVTGAVSASPSRPVTDVCFAGAAARVRQAALDGVLAGEVNGITPTRSLDLERTSPKQLFRKALAAHRAEAGKG